MQATAAPLGERLVVRGRIGRLLRYTQTLTLWHGVARVDCRTTIDEFTGADRLLRLRWPCPVPGAMPVSEVGDAVIGRGFALLHEPGIDESVDTAKHPWTLDNPATAGSGCRPRRGCASAQTCVRVSVAEVVSPTEATSAPLARDLVVALVRAGCHRDVQQRRQAPLRRSRRSTPTCRTPGSRSAAPTRTRSPQRCWPMPTRPTPRNSSGS